MGTLDLDQAGVDELARLVGEQGLLDVEQRDELDWHTGSSLRRTSGSHVVAQLADAGAVQLDVPGG